MEINSIFDKKLFCFFVLGPWGQLSPLQQPPVAELTSSDLRRDPQKRPRCFPIEPSASGAHIPPHGLDSSTMGRVPTTSQTRRIQNYPGGLTNIASSATRKVPLADPSNFSHQQIPGNPVTPSSSSSSSSSSPGNISRKQVFCKFCGKKFIDLTKYRAHESYHSREGRFPCSFCDKAFHCKENVVRHERTHTGERPFKCQFCPSEFSRKKTCQIHEATHFK